MKLSCYLLDGLHFFLGIHTNPFQFQDPPVLRLAGHIGSHEGTRNPLQHRVVAMKTALSSRAMSLSETTPQPIGLGLLGCGTVGGGVLRLLSENLSRIAERVGTPVRVRKILVRDLQKERVPECDKTLLTTNPEDLFADPSIHIIVEVMGGTGVAKTMIERAISLGKGVVTANKMLLAQSGPALFEQAKRARTDIAFEGAVGGGIPIIRTLRDAFAGDRVRRVAAILNGTCNYILTRMSEGNIIFDVALREAQQHGYAEADPTLDIDGHDAAHKLSILSMLAFGTRRAEPLFVEGIRRIDAVDIRFAARFGYTIKHLALGADIGDTVELRVHPVLLPKSSVLANVRGVLNAVLLEGEALGPCLVSGRGAGDMPTAVSVVADILDVARASFAGAPGLLTASVSLRERAFLSLGDIETAYYLRFRVLDRPRVMARLAGALGDHGISIEQIVQQKPEHGYRDDIDIADVVMITHVAKESAMRSALALLKAEDSENVLYEEPNLIRIEPSLG